MAKDTLRVLAICFTLHVSCEAIKSRQLPAQKEEKGMLQSALQSIDETVDDVTTQMSSLQSMLAEEKTREKAHLAELQAAYQAKLKEEAGENDALTAEIEKADKRNQDLSRSNSEILDDMKRVKAKVQEQRHVLQSFRDKLQGADALGKDVLANNVVSGDVEKILESGADDADEANATSKVGDVEDTSSPKTETGPKQLSLLQIDDDETPEVPVVSLTGDADVAVDMLHQGILKLKQKAAKSEEDLKVSFKADLKALKEKHAALTEKKEKLDATGEKLKAREEKLKVAQTELSSLQTNLNSDIRKVRESLRAAEQELEKAEDESAQPEAEIKLEKKATAKVSDEVMVEKQEAQVEDVKSAKTEVTQSSPASDKEAQVEDVKSAKTEVTQSSPASFKDWLQAWKKRSASGESAKDAAARMWEKSDELSEVHAQEKELNQQIHEAEEEAKRLVHEESEDSSAAAKAKQALKRKKILELKRAKLEEKEHSLTDELTKRGPL
eukprot:TRINITY_DN15494_c0_g1_i1.p1 TRINITY_DN15494_c0_g1~~TRINITY_DN15494_c0_g1_i1.p1  ORF type:complete len:498 (-),score=175.90 TRINITY_DN15494_c0_g1_i1:98-1591(-)